MPSYQTPRQTDSRVSGAISNPPKPDAYEVKIAQKTIWLAGAVRTRAEAEDLILTIRALQPMLPEPSTAPSPPPDAEETDMLG